MSRNDGRKLISSIRQGWAATNWPLRVLVVVSPTLGSIGLVAGYFGDIDGWSNHYPFVSNVASNLTGALFGLPIVYVFLQWVANVQAERLREIEKRERICRAASELHNSILSAIENSEVSHLGGLRRGLLRLETNLRPLPEMIQTVLDQRSPRVSVRDKVPVSLNACELVRVKSAQAVESMEAVASECNTVMVPQTITDAEQWWTGVRRAWQHLENELGKGWSGPLERGLVESREIGNTGSFVALPSTHPFDVLYAITGSSGLYGVLRQIREMEFTYAELRHILDTALYPSPASEVGTALSLINDLIEFETRVSSLVQNSCS